jgi:hypothetical protein
MLYRLGQDAHQKGVHKWHTGFRRIAMSSPLVELRTFYDRSARIEVNFILSLPAQLSQVKNPSKRGQG